jgi:hypothetical protein
MTTTFRTQVLHLPSTPLGLLPERWAVEHHCTLCRARVATDELIAHAQDHVPADVDGELHDRVP